MFHKAAELDPGYAPAWAGLAMTYNKDVFFMPGVGPDESIAKARLRGESHRTRPEIGQRLCVSILGTHEPGKLRAGA
jgi:hypothetical protein